MAIVAIDRHRVGIHDRNDTTADNYRHRETGRVCGQRFETWSNRRRLRISRRDGTAGADRVADHTGVRKCEIDRLRLRIARTEAMHLPTLDAVASHDDDGGASGFAAGRECKRIEDLAQGGGAI